MEDRHKILLGRIAAYKEWRKTHPNTHTDEENKAILESVRKRFVDWKNKQSHSVDDLKDKQPSSAKFGSPLQSVYKPGVRPVRIYTDSIRNPKGGKSRKQRKTKRPNQSRKQRKTKRPKQTRKQKKSKK